MKASVVVITYNQEAFLAETLNSVLAQQCAFDFEIVVGEDCSTDGTRKICLDYQARYPEKIHLLLHDKNQGLVENYYQALELCRGEYIATVAGDDYWCDPLKLQKQVSFLDSHPDYALTFGAMRKYEMASGLFREAPVRPCSGWIFDALIRRGNFVSAPTTCFRRSMFDCLDTREIRAQHFRTEDFPLWLGLSRLGKFHSMPDVLSVYRISPGSVGSPQSIDGKIQMYESNAAAVAFYLRKHQLGDVSLSRRLQAKYKYEIVKLLINNGKRQEAGERLGRLTGPEFFQWKIVKAYVGLKMPFLRRLLFKG